jgi:hypothetical protein
MTSPDKPHDQEDEHGPIPEAITEGDRELTSETIESDPEDYALLDLLLSKDYDVDEATASPVSTEIDAVESDPVDIVQARSEPVLQEQPKKAPEELTIEQEEAFLKLGDTLIDESAKVERRRGISRLFSLIKRREKTVFTPSDIPVSFAPIDAGIVGADAEHEKEEMTLLSLDITPDLRDPVDVRPGLHDLVDVSPDMEPEDMVRMVKIDDATSLQISEDDHDAEPASLIGKDAPESSYDLNDTLILRNEDRMTSSDADGKTSFEKAIDTPQSVDSGKKKGYIDAIKPVKRREKSPRRGAPPIQVLIGWIGESSRKDVIEHAKGFAEDHLETLETAWISLEPFREGWIFEVHEGGSGNAYLPEIIDQLSRDPDQVVWIPSGTALNRVMTVRISEGQVFAAILTESESALVRKSGQLPLERSGRMSRLLPKGNIVLALGSSMAAIATISLIATFQYSMMINQQPLPSRGFNAETLPHSQIIRLADGIRDDRWVSRIIFQEGQWRADFEQIAPVSLPVDDDGARRVIEEIYEEEDRIFENVLDTIERETAQ